MKINWPLPRWQQRLVALTILLALLWGCYKAVIEPLVLEPIISAQQSQKLLSERMARYQNILAHRRQVEQALKQMNTKDGLQQKLLQADDPNLAASELLSSLSKKIKQLNQNVGLCQLKQSMPVIGQIKPGKHYQPIKLSLSLNCEIKPLTMLLTDIEVHSKLLLVVENFSIEKSAKAASKGPAGALHVSLLVSGYHAVSAKEAQ